MNVQSVWRQEDRDTSGHDVVKVELDLAEARIIITALRDAATFEDGKRSWSAKALEMAEAILAVIDGDSSTKARLNRRWRAAREEYARIHAEHMKALGVDE